MTLSSGPDGDGNLAEQQFDPSRHIAPRVAHELNNILTVVQGYADTLLLREGQNSDLQPHLKTISDASRRAAKVVQQALPKNVNVIPGASRPNQNLQTAA